MNLSTLTVEQLQRHRLHRYTTLKLLKTAKGIDREATEQEIRAELKAINKELKSRT